MTTVHTTPMSPCDAPAPASARAPHVTRNLLRLPRPCSRPRSSQSPSLTAQCSIANTTSTLAPCAPLQRNKGWDPEKMHVALDAPVERAVHLRPRNAGAQTVVLEHHSALVCALPDAECVRKGLRGGPESSHGRYSDSAYLQVAARPTQPAAQARA